MRKILTQKFWSLGTSMGSMGSVSQKGPPEIFSNVVFLHPWGPNKAPSNAFDPSLAEKLITVPTRCDNHINTSFSYAYIHLPTLQSSAPWVD